MKKIAIMQPYFLPYIGYFQMIAAVDIFVFYDDVQFIKGGWINRNRIIINNIPNYLTIPINNASSNRLITETFVKKNQKEFTVLQKKIEQRYKKAPYFNDVFPLFQNIVQSDYVSISDLSIASVQKISEYLGIKTCFVISSQELSDTRIYKSNERLTMICQRFSANNYVNAIGGQNLYSKKEFENSGISLNFLRSTIPHQKIMHGSIYNVSIIHLLMYYSVNELRDLLEDYELI